jgi:chemotaxis protein methyltransferase CheR
MQPRQAGEAPASPFAKVDPIEVRLFLEAIYAKYGYDLRGYAPASMRRRVLAALAKSGLDNLGELQHRILHDSALFASVLEDLTVRVSEMFRDPIFYRSFRARVVPLLRTYPLLKIWHAGCASGEEAYAMAIVLTEEGLYDRAQIYATDMSPQALEQAKQGVYSVEHLQTFRENYESSGGQKSLDAYYTAAYGRIALRESLRKNILFFQHNLATDHVFGEMHVICCRNVLLYFGTALRDLVLRKLADSICMGGFLCLGLSERLPLTLSFTRGGAVTRFGEFAPLERIYRYSV